MSFPSSAWSDIWYVLETLVFNCFLLCSRAKRWAYSSRCWSEVQITDATEWTACLSLILAVSMDFWSKDLLLASFRKEWSVEVRCWSSRDVIFTFEFLSCTRRDVLPKTPFPFLFVFSSATFLYISCYLFLTISLFILLFQLLVQSCHKSSPAMFPLSDQEVSVLLNINHLKSICMRHWTDLENLKWKASLFLFSLSVFLFLSWGLPTVTRSSSYMIALLSSHTGILAGPNVLMVNLNWWTLSVDQLSISQTAFLLLLPKPCFCLKTAAVLLFCHC